MPETLRNDLDAVEKATQSATPELARDFFGVSLMRDSLERRREQVLEQLAGVLDVALVRDVSAGTGAELGLVASVLSALQDSLASIAQVIAGEPTARGLIPASIKEEVELRIAAASPGSLNLRLVPAAPAQPPLFPNRHETLLDLSVQRLASLLELNAGDRGALLSNVADLGPRVASHVQLLTGALTDNHASVSIHWKSEAIERETEISSAQAGELRTLLRSVETSSREVVYTGRLVGGSLFRRTFELALERSAELGPIDATVIAGRVDDETLEALEEHFGDEVTATVLLQESRLPSGETKETFVLRRLGV